jgi:hypothetical protein
MVLASDPIGVFLIFPPPSGHHPAGVVVLVKLHDEICIQPLFGVPKFVVFLDLYRKEHPNTPPIVIID